MVPLGGGKGRSTLGEERGGGRRGEGGRGILGEGWGQGGGHEGWGLPLVCWSATPLPGDGKSAVQARPAT